MKTCPDCGCRIYEYGCVNCNEADYIEAQSFLNEACGRCGDPTCFGGCEIETEPGRAVTLAQRGDDDS